MSTDARTDPLIDVATLQEQLDGPEETRPVLLDARYRLDDPDGRAAHENGHLPGAAYIDVDTALAHIRPDGVGGRHPMPDAETFAAAMRAAGVRNDRPVVAYDDWLSLAASRAWWLLRYFGKSDVRVLDGGLAAWRAAALPLETGPVHPDAGDFTADPGHARLLTAEDAQRYAERGFLLDARPADRFRGENEVIDPVAGHIPGARCLPALDTVDERGMFRPADALAVEAAGVGVRPGDDVGTYCGSGIQATHLALVLRHAGVNDDAGVYIGSWSDWITDLERPVELGAPD
ncbi:MAG TPA: sulfurtransferase [Segeticoccus sp.]|uniref:sulfurtransferase n=1 Tax=Segeticoccus sp. TaxID=2706531 RepID=UPI002D80659F|nr:sulfurtransferase [Segeticoccus sp.]HET8600472.1 sulfurtransferase [Segeticoccus sp.]